MLKASELFIIEHVSYGAQWWRRRHHIKARKSAEPHDLTVEMNVPFSTLVFCGDFLQIEEDGDRPQVTIISESDVLKNE